MTLATFYSLYTALKQDQYISFFIHVKIFICRPWSIHR